MDRSPKLNRRQFIATAGMASLSLTGRLPAAVISKRRLEKTKSKGDLSPTTINGSVEHQSGIPLGGIGAGSVEIRPDGYFHDWLIFNLGSWSPNVPKEEQVAQPDMGPGALSFFVRTKQAGTDAQLRRLGTREDQNELYSLRWVKSVQAIEYSGVFPRADLRYRDDSLPVTVESKFFSPFIPHDSKTSGTPGFHGVFRITNSSQNSVEVSLMGCLKNPIAAGNEERKLRNEVQTTDDSAMVVMRTDCEGPRKSTLGSMSFSLKGGQTSYVLGDFEGYLSNGTWFGSRNYGSVYDTYLRSFRDTGELQNLKGSESPADELMLTDEQIAALPPSDKDALVEKLYQYPSLACFLDRIKRIGPEELTSEDGKARVLQDLRSRLDQMAGKDRKPEKWGGAAISSSIRLKPGESQTIEFALAWHFPHHLGPDGTDMGHSYEEWFAEAPEANRFLIANAASHAATVDAFTAALTDTTLAPAICASWTEQLSTLTKCTWRTRAGRFGVWEGLGCCGFHTMDITYQGSFSILALFPDLQKGQMKMGADFQRADGRVAHFFTPDLLHVDNGFDRVDMNPQFVMLVCRDYLWTGDRDYLQRVFPHVVRAIANSAKLDTNGDGLPDHDTRRNTYDNWNFFGTPAYIASLWLGSLLAGERMARDIGQFDLASEWMAIRKKGESSFEKLLWNGEYYSLWVDGENRDECCMTDQLSGIWFSHLMGLGSALPEDRVKAALKAILKHNFSSETGLINATYPPGRAARFSTDMNGQATACWTGVEYAFVSLLLSFGMHKDAAEVAESITDAYRRAGRVWNHVECGDHYYRAMSSWSTLIAATGFQVDASNKVVCLLPEGVAPMKGPWVSSTGWGTFEASASRLSVRCLSGVLEFAELRLPSGFSGNRALLNGSSQGVRVVEADGRRAFRFSKLVSLSKNQMLDVG